MALFGRQLKYRVTIQPAGLEPARLQALSSAAARMRVGRRRVIVHPPLSATSKKGNLETTASATDRLTRQFSRLLIYPPRPLDIASSCRSTSL